MPFASFWSSNISTYHSSLHRLSTMKREGALLNCRLAKLEKYQYSFIHWLGNLQRHVDGISWLPKSTHLIFLSPETLQKQCFPALQHALNTKFTTINGLVLELAGQTAKGANATQHCTTMLHRVSQVYLGIRKTLTKF